MLQQAFLIFREQHCFFHEVLPGKVPYGIDHSQTSHAREAHYLMAERVGSWCGFWTHGGTGSRKHPQLVQQRGAQILQHE